MCLLSFHMGQHPIYKLIFCANRDESYARPTKEAHFWDDFPFLLGGRDLEQMGTWLGITKSGRLAALTNYREKTMNLKGKKSRGEIVTSYLTGNESPINFLERLRTNNEAYNGFNVIVGNVNQLYYYGNRQQDIISIDNGTHALSNHLLNTPWPKAELLKNSIEQYVHQDENIAIEKLFNLLNNQNRAQDIDLPKTGVDVEIERLLSPIFIQSEKYGTRSSTVILVTHNNEVTFVERTFQDGNFVKDNKFEFNITHD